MIGDLPIAIGKKAKVKSKNVKRERPILRTYTVNGK
jgi:hypothetical protein